MQCSAFDGNVGQSIPHGAEAAIPLDWALCASPYFNRSATRDWYNIVGISSRVSRVESSRAESSLVLSKSVSVAMRKIIIVQQQQHNVAVSTVLNTRQQATSSIADQAQARLRWGCREQTRQNGKLRQPKPKKEKLSLSRRKSQSLSLFLSLF